MDSLTLNMVTPNMSPASIQCCVTRDTAPATIRMYVIAEFTCISIGFGYGLLNMTTRIRKTPIRQPITLLPLYGPALQYSVAEFCAFSLS
jgi:hypothetical protein